MKNSVSLHPLIYRKLCRIGTRKKCTQFGKKGRTSLYSSLIADPEQNIYVTLLTVPDFFIYPILGRDGLILFQNIRPFHSRPSEHNGFTRTGNPDTVGVINFSF